MIQIYDFTVRALESRHIHHVLDIDLKGTDFAWTIDEWIFACDHYQVLVAFADSTAIGIVAFTRECEQGYIEKLVVRKDWRGKGIGSRLLAAVEESLKEFNTDSISILIPEYRIYPDQGEFVGSFFNRNGYKAEPPVIPDKFSAWGQTHSGYVFTKEVQHDSGKGVESDQGSIRRESGGVVPTVGGGGGTSRTRS